MYEIYLDDSSKHVLARADTFHAAELEVDRIADETMAQLAANSEGQEHFFLSLAVRDAATKEVAMRSGVFR